jgi:hypothetical protein
MHCREIWKNGGGVWRLTGTLEFDDLLRLILNRNLHCRFRKAEYLINDFQGVTGIELSEDELSTLVDFEKESMGLAPHLKMAFVVNKESYKKLIERFIEKMPGCSWRIAVFDRFDLAYEWAVGDSWESLR